MGRRKPTLRVLGKDRQVRRHRLTGVRLPFVAAALAALIAVLAGCGGNGERPAAKSSAPPPSPTAAKPVPAPATDACYTMSFAEAVAPTADASPQACRKPHTTETYAVGRLDNVVNGHLVAVDSARVQQQVASACTKPLATYLGGSTEDIRLSMLRPVWFTPSIKASEQGAKWYRCDVIAIGGKDKLVSVKGRLKGVLGNDSTANTYGLCSTAKPETADSSRVPCGEKHTWKAVSTVTLPAGKYPGEDAARTAAEAPCKDAARDAAADALNFDYGYEWPTKKQWAAGQTYDVCWAPDES